MPTDYVLLEELLLTGEGFIPLPAEYENYPFACYVDDCWEPAVLQVFVETTTGGGGEYIQKCEGHARLHYDREYQALRLKWRRAGWGE